MTRNDLSEIDRKLAEALDNYDWLSAKECLKLGADANLQMGYALSSSVWEGNEEMIRYLLTSPELPQHADINTNPSSLSLICINAFAQKSHLLEYLLSMGLDLEEHARQNLQAAASYKSPEALKFIHKAGIDLRLLNDLAFRMCIENEQYGHLDYLLENGVDVHRNYEVALRKAIEDDRFTLADYLINHKADLDKAYEHSSDDLRKKIESFRLERELNSSLPINNNKMNKLKI